MYALPFAFSLNLADLQKSGHSPSFTAHLLFSSELFYQSTGPASSGN
jgi:hypothetical protein